MTAMGSTAMMLPFMMSSFPAGTPGGYERAPHWL